MRRVLIVGAISLLATSCGVVSANDADRTDVTVKMVTVQGRTVPCVVVAKSTAVAVSCNWGNQ